jgi:fermentation-respiration switch protein FrsA (DUF1100 family)
LAVGFLFGYVKYIENKGIFYPVKEVEFDPSYIRLAFEDVYISTKDGFKINGWFIPSSNASYTILFCHGNAGNIGHRLDKINLLHGIGLNIFILDYRGYGRSQGKPSENGFYLDAQAAYDYLVNNRKIDPKKIILYGESIGTAVAIDLAAKVEVKAFIVEGAFSSGKDMAKRIYPFLPPLIFSNRFDSSAKIKKISAEKLFIHSREDEIVPLALAMKLYSFADAPKQFIEIYGGHNTAFLDAKEKYIFSIKSFIDNLR